MRKWLLLACAVVLQSAIFLACGNTDGLDTPMIADCNGCTPALSGGGGGALPNGNGFDAGGGATLEGSVPLDGGTFVDVGVTGNDVFGDTPGTVDVGVSFDDAFPF
ncbi:MAG TPA: hypothetical protein VGH28_26475 [Polyangiaceae bacterium]